MNIGLFGFGCVGQGLYDVLGQSTGFRAGIQKIAIRDGAKVRSLPAHLFTTRHSDILDDPDIHLIVELIDDAEVAWEIARRALEQGKSVVSANKKMIAHHLEALVGLQAQHQGAFLYEAGVCGSIPILRNLEEYYDNETLSGISGIFNGSSNYILTRMSREGMDYARALQEAQALGFAESNPWLDVAGYDAKYKLVIAAAHAFGLFVHPEQVLNLGIEHLSEADFEAARQLDCTIRLVAQARRTAPGKVALSVLPQFVPREHLLHNVEHEYNAVIVESAFAQQQLFVGKGAGGHPTGAAVLSDISARQYDYKYEYKKLRQGQRYEPDFDQVVTIYLRTQNPELAALLDMQQVHDVHSYPNGLILHGETTLGRLLHAQKVLEREACFVAGLEWVEEQSRSGLKKVMTQWAS